MMVLLWATASYSYCNQWGHVFQNQIKFYFRKGEPLHSNTNIHSVHSASSSHWVQGSISRATKHKSNERIINQSTFDLYIKTLCHYTRPYICHVQCIQNTLSDEKISVLRKMQAHNRMIVDLHLVSFLPSRTMTYLLWYMVRYGLHSLVLQILHVHALATL